MKRVFAHIGFSFALTLVILNLISIKGVLVVFVIASALFIVSLLIKKTREAVAVPLCLFSAILACLLFSSCYYGSYVPQVNLDGKTAEAEFYIVDLEEHNDYGYTYTVKTKSVDVSGAPQNIKLRLKSKDKIPADYYQIVKGELKFSKISDNGYESYGSFGENIFLRSKLTKYAVTNKFVNSLNKYILRLRVNIRNLFFEELPKDNATLALALVTGDKSEMNTEIKNNFKSSGASHLMAVSGLHLTVVSGALYFILKKLRVPETSRIIVSLFAIIFYISLSGFSKSIIRAGIMMVVFLIGKLFKEKSDLLNSLGFATFLICFNPFAVTDVGAMLTVTAVLGLATINKEIVKLYMPRNKIIAYCYKILMASFSIFVTTFPVMYFSFGTVSLIGMFVNILLIPVAEVALVSSFLIVIFQFLSPVLFVFTFVSKIATEILIVITKFCAKLSFAVANINSVEVGLIISAIFLLFGFSFIIKKKNTLKITSVISIVLVFVVSLTSYVINYNNIYVREINGYNSTAMIVYDRNNAVVIGVSDSSQYYVVDGLIESKSLNVSMIVDTTNSDYSRKLSNSYSVKNYVVNSNIENSNNNKSNNKNDIKCKNVVTTNNFDVDLWDELNVKYMSDENGVDITLKVYNTDFSYSSDMNYNSYAYKNKNDYSDNCDIIYTVNNYGFSDWRVNQWLK